MIEAVSRTKLYDYRTTAVTATSTAYEPTLSVYLAPNTVYEVACQFFVSGGSDGVRFILQYLGTFQTNYLDLHVNSTHSALSINSAIIYPTLVGTESVRITGLFKTGSAENLRFSFRKNTDASTDTTVEVGSYLVARPFP